MAEKISFTVSARTARLIGQENFSNAEGAIIELVKNCYDADASTALVIFDLRYDGAPGKINKSEYETILKEDSELVKICYNYNSSDESFILLENLSKKVQSEIHSLFKSLNAIFIIDNGEGMSEDTIRKKWMQIGTDNKLLDIKSAKGRVKTGAKGLGRFALDRLGELSDMKTISVDSPIGYSWLMNWKQFETQDKTLTDIRADFDSLNSFKLKEDLLSSFSGDKVRAIFESPEIDFNHGTIIKISRLRDDWDDQSISKLFKSLESLIPPKELGLFRIFLFKKAYEEDFGEVSTHYFNNYEYKIESEFNANALKVNIKIIRQELDIPRINKEFSDIFSREDSPPPYDLPTVTKGFFEYEKDVPTMLKWKREDSEKYLTEVGDFKFSFYFTKLSKPGKEDFKVYPYISNDYSKFTEAFEKFGGIKIYRDYFRVRPYGEPGDDWLELGKRQASSPASAGQRVGDWRVRAKQIAGVIDISRIQNPHLRDKSDRSSLIENIPFETFKKIIIGIIAEFEYDRSRLLHPFFKKGKEDREKREKEELRKRAEEIAKELFAKQNDITETNAAISEQTTTIIEQKLQEFSEEKEAEKIKEESDKDIELRTVRTLASLGLIIASFDHELKSISNNLQPRLKYLEKHLANLIHKEKLKSLPDNKNPFKLIEHIKVDHEKLKGWLDYSINSIRLDKRKRKSINLASYFDQFSKNWKFVLKERNVQLDLIGTKSRENSIRAFETDLDTIYNNLLTNSLEAFKLRREKYKRVVSVTWKSTASNVEVTYSDNGVGLSEVFVDPTEIFRPFVTTKKDKRGNEIGTGLGMYLVKNVVDDYKGEVELIKLNPGFQIKITFNKILKE